MEVIPAAASTAWGGVLKVGIFGPQQQRAWRRAWALEQLPTFYTRDGQRLVDALYHRMVLETEGIPGGAAVIYLDVAHEFS